MPQVIVTFDCPNEDCEGVVEETLFISDPDYSADVHSEGDAMVEEYVACSDCGNDYTVSLVNHMSIVTAEILDHGETRVSTSVIDEPDYLEDYEPPSNAFDLYERASGDLQALLFTNAKEPDDGILYRMIFSQFIAVFEAFLTDRLLREAIDHLEIRKRVSKLGKFQDKNLTVADVVADPEIGWKNMRAQLQAQLYHKLDEVRKLYQVAFKFDMFDNDAEKETIAAAIVKRHDCVHRNGRDKDDVMNLFPASDILDLHRALDVIVQRVENGVNHAIATL